MTIANESDTRRVTAFEIRHAVEKEDASGDTTCMLHTVYCGRRKAAIAKRSACTEEGRELQPPHSRLGLNFELFPHAQETCTRHLRKIL